MQLETFMFHNYEKNWDYVRRYGEESLQLRREIGDRIGMAWSLYAVAIGEARIGHFAEAEQLWLEEIELGHQTSISRHVASGYGQVSHQVYFIQGDFAKARAAAEEALKSVASVYQTFPTGWALVTLGLLASMEERYQEGKTLCQQGAAVTYLITIVELAAWGSSVAACGLGDYESARECLSTSLNYMTDNRGLVGMIACLPIAAIILAHNGHKAHAVELLGFAFNHPIQAAGWLEKWPLLTRFRAELEQTLGPTDYSAAWERGKRLEAETVEAELQLRFALKVGINQLLQDPLTERELEVLNLLANGLSNTQIAQQLIIAIGTTKSHIHNIYSKLQVETRVQAVTRARKLNLL